MRGGAGDDQYVIRQLNHSVIEGAGGGIDTAWVEVNGWTVASNVEFAYLRGSATSITGSTTGGTLVANPTFGSTLTMGAGFTTVWGSNQADTVHVGTGGGNIYLRDGADRIILGEHWGLTQVADFSRSGGDRLDLSQSGLNRSDLYIQFYNGKALIDHSGEQVILYGDFTTRSPEDFLIF